MILLGRVIIVDLPKVYLFLLGLLIMGINSYMFFGRKQYIDIEQRYLNEDRLFRIKNKLYAFLYVVFSILFLIMALAYLDHHPIISR